MFLKITNTYHVTQNAGSEMDSLTQNAGSENYATLLFAAAEGYSE